MRFVAKVSVLIFIIFLDSSGIVHKEFLPPGQTVNHAFYKDILERLRKQVQRVRKNNADDWTLHRNNAPAHTGFQLENFWRRKIFPPFHLLPTAQL
jgi:hypothetical protein